MIRPTRTVLALTLWISAFLSLSAQTTPNILFVGNSFTHGQYEPLHSYNKANVYDTNAGGFNNAGGVPGVFKKMASDLGYACNVNIEAVSSQTLVFHYNNEQPTIGQSKWQAVVLQDYSTQATSIGDVNAFNTEVGNLRNLIMTANPYAKIFLYETWARPDICRGNPFANMNAMLSELHTNYFNASTNYSVGYAPVGDAFARAITDGYATPNPMSGIDAGKFNLWYYTTPPYSPEGYHPSAWGGYLAGAVFIAKITGLDPRNIPTGSGSTAAGLGISSTDAAHLNTVAYEMTTTVPVITNANSASFAIGQGSSFAFTATGLPTPTFSATGLPVWASLNPTTGVLSGTPPDASGSPFAITLTVTNGASSTATQSFTLNVGNTAGPTITNSLPASVLYATAYNFVFSTTGTPTPTFSVTSGSLPAGLTLISNGTVSGTPWQTGLFTGVITAGSGNGTTTQNFSIAVQRAPYFINGPPPDQVQVNTAYANFTYQAAGYPASFTFSYTGNLPPGMSLTSGGTLSGTPTSTGTYTATINASNGIGSPATQALTIVVQPGAVSQVIRAIDCGSGSSYTASDGTIYLPDQYVTGSGGKIAQVYVGGTNDPALYTSYRYGTCTYSIPVPNGNYFVDLKICETQNAFPGDRQFTAEIQGTPVLACYDISANVGDNMATVQTFPATVTNGLLIINITSVKASSIINAIVVRTLQAAQAPAITNGPATTSASVGIGYGYAYQTTGSPAPTFSMSSGNLPPGLTLTPAGLIYGTPTTAGSYSGKVSAGNGVGSAVTQNFSIVVAANSTSATPVITDGPPSSIGTPNVPYTFNYTASGVPAPTFSISSGILPAGLSFSSAGVISGTPTAIGTSALTVRASNGVGTGPTQTFTITVQQSVQPTITNGPATATAIMGNAYSFTYTATGYPAPTFSMTSGNLPQGMSLSSGGAILGTPTTLGTYTGTVTASNGIGNVATQNFTIAVQSVPPPTVNFNFAYNASSLGNWNSLYSGSCWLAGQPGATIANAKDFNTGTLTGIGLSVTSSFTFGQSYGVASSALYSSPIQSYEFATTGTASLTVNGLNPALPYNVTAFGSGASGLTGLGNFTIGTTTLYLAIAGNTSNTVVFNNVMPDNTGRILLTVAKGTMNNYNDIGVLIVSQAGSAPVITNSPSAIGTAGTAYSFTYSATGTPTPTFSVTSGSLPAGLTLSSSGTISGTPTGVGVFKGTVSAVNGIGTATSSFSILVMGSYNQWAASRFTAQQQNDPNFIAPTSIPLQDGISNLLKYALDINPASAMSSADMLALPKSGVSGPYLTITYRQNPAATGITVSLQISSDLITWQNTIPDINQTVGTDPATGDPMIQVGINVTDLDKKFIRLSVSQP